MSDQERWNERYRTDDAPWDTGRPEPLFVEALGVHVFPNPPARLLEIGCGVGTNARFFAAAGYEVVGVDLSTTAIDRAVAHADSGAVRFEVLDVLREPLPEGPFDVVVDRGCFHVFDAHEDRRTFVDRVATALRPGGVWLSIVGSTEGPARDAGPRAGARSTSRRRSSPRSRSSRSIG